MPWPPSVGASASAARPATNGSIATPNKASPDWPINPKRPNGKRKPSRDRARDPGLAGALSHLQAFPAEDKLKTRLERTNPDINWPAHSTIGALLKRHGLTHPGKRRRHATPSSKLTSAKAPNQVWAIDFKGWFETGDGKRCDPLTISDTASRYLLRCQRVARSDTAHVRPLMEATFREYGLPTRILSDNGPPFASTGGGAFAAQRVVDPARDSTAANRPRTLSKTGA